MLVGSTPERQQLEELDDAIERWMRTVREQADSIDAEQFHRFRETAQKLALRFEERLPPSLEPSAANEVRTIMIGGLRKIDEVGDDRPLDVLDDFLLRAESIRHILRDALDEDLPAAPDDTKMLATLLVAWLGPRITRRRIGELLGVTERTVQRWLDTGGRPSRRLYLVTRLVVLLKDAWTPEGVLAWFDRPRPSLGGKRPIDVIDEPEFEQVLLQDAREGRAQHGS
jgi:uncharacterized protein (DUF2384 family)